VRVEISTDAHEDLANGHAFYERQSSGLGGYFADTLYSEIESLQIYAGIHPIRNGFYRMLARRFPYSIFYQIEGDVARVYAVLDNRMNPIRIRRMLRDR
jgi:plasmid stabilization system protein ParE